MKPIIYLIAISIFASCTQVDRKQKISQPVARSIKIQPADSQQVYIEDITDSIRYITLQTNKDFSFRFITNFVITGENILVCDRTQNKIFIFSKAGVPERMIVHSPITDMLYDEDSGEIQILDISMNRIFRFDTKGQFKGDLAVAGISYLGLSLAKNKNMYVCEMISNKNNTSMARLSTFNKEEESINYVNQQLSYPPIIQDLNILYPHKFDNYKDSLFYFPLLDNKIYHVTATQSSPVYELELPAENSIGDQLKAEHPAKDNFEYWRKMKAYNTIFENNSLFINDNWVFFRYCFQTIQQTRNVFFSKKTGKVIQFASYASRINKNFHIKSPVIGKTGNFFVVAIPPEKSKIKPASKKGPVNDHRPIKLMLFTLKDGL